MLYETSLYDVDRFPFSFFEPSEIFLFSGLKYYTKLRTCIELVGALLG